MSEFSLDASTERALVLLRRVATRTTVPGTITRGLGSEALEAAFADVATSAAAAGLEVRRDGFGNLIARRHVEGTSGTLLLGGHLDSVPDAGAYDGVLGVVTALAAIERLGARERPLPFSLELVAFADEEGSRFQGAYLGSRAFLGALREADLARADVDGISLASLIDRSATTNGAGRPDAIGWIEAHIEQGPVLEQTGRALGVVAAIAGQTRIRVRLTGAAGHAGTVPMEARSDALVGAAEAIVGIERTAQARPGARGTVGEIEVPGMASNVVPGVASFTIDLRHAVDDERQALVAECHALILRAARERDLTVDWELVSSTPATACDPELRAAIAQGIRSTGSEPLELVSGAGHDAAALAVAMPVAMLFVRCRGGISHNPAEQTEPADIELAVTALTAAIEELAARRGPRSR